MNRTTPLFLFLITFTLGGIVCASEQPARSIEPATVTMKFPAAFGKMQRPPVEFDHRAHTEALEPTSCETCHRIDDEGVLTPHMASALEIENRDDLIDAFHDSCVGCHRERAAEGLVAGPVTCGLCHVRRAPGVPTRAAMAFDYSLHARHTKAFEDKCENCHHVYDESAEKLKYEKGQEEGCAACHGAVDEERKLSLANASHRACISCHLRRIRLEQESGPSLCVGCHDLQNRDSIRVLEEIPRLVRGQKDTQWISGEQSKSAAVAFNHLAHEPLTSSCSNCHHQTLKPCDDCHTLTGSPEGSGVTMVQAYHLASSEHSCVGCHAEKTAKNECAGCHSALNKNPAERSCVFCHSGPLPGSDGLQTAPVFADLELDPLPLVSDDFPETVVIEGLVDHYAASKLPHAKIVGKLDEITRGSKLAMRFHADTETLCGGCHHHSPVGTRPPPCRSCHSEVADQADGRPGLKVAYHQQCLGCHIAMDIPKQGCTDCHAVREES